MVEGNVEISSSNFHLTPEGNVTMSGTITATMVILVIENYRW